MERPGPRRGPARSARAGPLLPRVRAQHSRRLSAYQGSYWITGNRIDYLDDLGFWAYGEFQDGILHHAGYRFTRR
ncbi:Atu4866 domain-containing protein [Kitasatospora sp. NPDC089509]|uniref:Atu4866 domain-containing protein n=1 Tax=Kitasatospora sp. NPDC089509 TaxID=3364079 RepID=UPI0038120CA6